MKSKMWLGVAMLGLVVGLIGCTDNSGAEVRKIIKEAEGMSKNELYAKAIEELDGKEMFGIGNSSRGATAKEYFISYLKGEKYDNATKKSEPNDAIKAEFPGYKADFTGKITWSQPKSGKIFDQLTGDIQSNEHTYAMTLIQDANQIQSKMLDEKLLYNYIPKEWKGDKDTNGEPFALQSLNKVFMYNNIGGKVYDNVWDFVAANEAPNFMDYESETVGKNFLIMLTSPEYSKIMESAYTHSSNGYQATAEEWSTIDAAVKKMGLSHPNAKYSVLWIYRWLKQYSTQTDDGPICNNLVNTSSSGQSALIVYSKLRSVAETDNSSKTNINIAAYQPGYEGIGGFSYKHYLQVVKTSPFPWTSCAFIHFMTTSKDGFSAWGADIGGYCSDPNSNQDHTNDGQVNGVDKFPALNDKGYEWWTSPESGKGRLVIEQPKYLAEWNFKVGSWMNLIR